MKVLNLLFLAICFITRCAGCDTQNISKPSEPIDSDGLKLAWKTTVGTDIRTIPLIAGDSLVIGGGETSITALRLKNGAIKWNSKEGIPTSFSTRRISANGTQVFGYQDVGGYSLGLGWDIETGKLLWQMKGPIEWELFGNPSSDDNYAYMSGKDVYKIDIKSGAILQTFPTTWSSFGALLTGNDAVVFQARSGEPIANNWEGIIQSFDRGTGMLNWEFKTLKGGFISQGIIENNVLYAGTKENPEATFYALDLNDGKVIWEAKEGWMPTEAFTDMSEQYIFLNDGGAVRALDKQTGKQRWKTNLDSGYGGSNLVYHEGYVYHPSGRILFVLNAQTGAIVHREYIEGGYVWNVAKSSKLLIARTSRAYNAYQYYQPN